uniref:Uncharacterized protein n=1 Tax=Anguilla anguilla TaxID=7936 RepID=A0A0E9V312_ANGAN
MQQATQICVISLFELNRLNNLHNDWLN